MSKPVRIAVFGEYFIDRYHIGTARGLSAEAPIPIIDVQEQLIFPGGAGNVASNLTALGANVYSVYPYIHPIKNRLVVDNHQLARWDESDKVLPFTNKNNVQYAFEACDGVILSDYAKGAFDNLQAFENLPTGVPLFIDTKRDPRYFKPITDLNTNATFFPNLSEYTHHLNGYTWVRQNHKIVLKQGPHGLTSDPSRTDISYHVPARARKVVSVNGAGDTVIAAFALAYCQGYSPDAALEFAGRAAGIACEHPYTYAVTQQDMKYA